MPDREKYIEILSMTAKKAKEFNEDVPIRISLECIEDILELLKEQDAVYPSWQNGKMYCGHCGSKFPPRVMMRFCHRCGVPVKLKVNDIVEPEGR